ncbi:MAG: hypothetical protein IJB79_04245 [Candidatus Gastranaerophilales bacterium]|nr:hypothetical protein [Candidatus Gastranaerophilales bacterium]
MKKILCFGDSNTYGFNPVDFSRYDETKRWSAILKKYFKITEKGCNNRSLFNNEGELNSLEIINKYLSKDYDYIILQIGINDLQFQYDVDLNKFSEKLEELINLIKNYTKIILLCPNTIDNCILKSYFSSLFNKDSIEKSKKLVEIYKKIALKNNCIFVDLNNIASVSKIDGLHYDIENHQKIANSLKEILDNN